MGEERNWALWVRSVALTGAFLLGLSTFQAEFDFGVPQFRCVFAPMLVAFAAGAGLVAARVWLGRGAAIGAAIFFLALRGIIALIVGEGLDQSTPYFPLYLGSAIVVELVALVVSTRNEIRYALAAGVGIGTVGLASEWAWSQVMMPISWSSELLPGGRRARLRDGDRRRLRRRLDRRPARRRRAPADEAAAPRRARRRLRGRPHGRLRPLQAGRHRSQRHRRGRRRRQAAAPMSPSPSIPPDAAEDAEWLNVTAWQGGGLVVDELERTGPGEYRIARAGPRLRRLEDAGPPP